MNVDLESVINNIQRIYDSTTSWHILRDFERVLDEFYDIYAFDNWADGELVKGPIANKYWVTCYFMWDYDKKPDLSVIKRLRSNGIKCKKGTAKFIEPVKIQSPDDIRPGTQKGKFKNTKKCVIGIKISKKDIRNIAKGVEDIFAANEAEEADQTPPETDTTSAPMDMPPVTDAGGSGMPPAMGSAPVAPGVI